MRSLKKGIYTRNYQLGRKKNNFFAKFSTKNRVRNELNGPRRRMRNTLQAAKIDRGRKNSFSQRSLYPEQKKKIPSLLTDMIFDDRDQNLLPFIDNPNWKKSQRQPSARETYKNQDLPRGSDANTEICRKWMKFGECMYGDHCKYRHYTRHSDNDRMDHSIEPSTSRLSYDSERASIRSHKYGSSNSYLDVPPNYRRDRNSSGSSNQNAGIHHRGSPLVGRKMYTSPNKQFLSSSEKNYENLRNPAPRNRNELANSLRVVRSPSLASTSDSEKFKEGASEKRFKPSSVIVVVNKTSSPHPSGPEHEEGGPRRHELRHHHEPRRPTKITRTVIGESKGGIPTAVSSPLKGDNRSSKRIVPSTVVSVNLKSKSSRDEVTKRSSGTKSPPKKHEGQPSRPKSPARPKPTKSALNGSTRTKVATATRTNNKRSLVASGSTRIVSSIRSLARQTYVKKKVAKATLKQPLTASANPTKGQASSVPTTTARKPTLAVSSLASTTNNTRGRSIITRCVLLPSKKKMLEAALKKKPTPGGPKDGHPDPKADLTKQVRSGSIFPESPAPKAPQLDKGVILKRNAVVVEKFKANLPSSGSEIKPAVRANNGADDKLVAHATTRRTEEEETASLEDLEKKRQLLLFELQKEQLEETSSSPSTISNLDVKRVATSKGSKSPSLEKAPFIPVTEKKIYLMQNLPDKKMADVAKPRTFVPRSVVKPLADPKKVKMSKNVQSGQKPNPPQNVTSAPVNSCHGQEDTKRAPGDEDFSPLSETSSLEHMEGIASDKNYQKGRKISDTHVLTKESDKVHPKSKSTKQVKTNTRSIAETYFNDMSQEDEELKEMNENLNTTTVLKVSRAQAKVDTNLKLIKVGNKQIRKINTSDDDSVGGSAEVEGSDTLVKINESDIEEGECYSSSSSIRSYNSQPHSDLPRLASRSSTDSKITAANEAEKKVAGKRNKSFRKNNRPNSRANEKAPDKALPSPHRGKDRLNTGENADVPRNDPNYVIPWVVKSRPARDKSSDGECKLGGARPADSDEEISVVAPQWAVPGSKKLPASDQFITDDLIGGAIPASLLSPSPRSQTPPLATVKNAPGKQAQSKTPVKFRAEIGGEATEPATATNPTPTAAVKVEDYESISSEDNSCLDAEEIDVKEEFMGEASDVGERAFVSSNESDPKSTHNVREKLVPFLWRMGVSRDLVSANTYETIVNALGKPFKHPVAAFHSKCVEEEEGDVTILPKDLDETSAVDEALKILDGNQILTRKLDLALRSVLLENPSIVPTRPAEIVETNSIHGIFPKLIPPFFAQPTGGSEFRDAPALLRQSLDRYRRNVGEREQALYRRNQALFPPNPSVILQDSISQ